MGYVIECNLLQTYLLSIMQKDRDEYTSGISDECTQVKKV